MDKVSISGPKFLDIRSRHLQVHSEMRYASTIVGVVSSGHGRLAHSNYPELRCNYECGSKMDVDAVGAPFARVLRLEW
jgi:hypothetical protein